MKRPSQYLAIVGFTMMIWGAFSLPVSASTIYQQLSDSSGSIELGSGCGYTVLADFQVSANVVLSNRAFVYVVVTNNGASPIDPSFVISLNGSNLYGFDGGATSTVPNDGQDYFMEIPYNSGTTELTVGTTYQIRGCAPAVSGVSVRTNLAGLFVYGYITDDGASSVPITAGSPGFTDVGISTTSQQVYCNRNFSTSTGFLSDVASDLANGVCNVAVFLFVPSNGALSSWQTLSSTTRDKIPFSYYYDVSTTLTTAHASSSQNFSSFGINFASLDFASSTAIGSFLPQGNFDFLSSSTIGTYVSPELHDAIFFLIRAAIWVTLMFVIYRRIVPHKPTI